MMNNSTRPWLNLDGTVKSDTEISLLGKKWSQQTWDLYLDEMLDARENNSNEALELFDLVDLIGDQPYSKYPNLKAFIQECFNKLSPSEQKILYGIYWRKVPERQLAKELSVERGSISNFKRRGLKKIKKLILQLKKENEPTAQQHKLSS